MKKNKSNSDGDSYPCVFVTEIVKGGGGLSGPVQDHEVRVGLKEERKCPPSLFFSFHSFTLLRTRSEVQIHCQSECD